MAVQQVLKKTAVLIESDWNLKISLFPYCFKTRNSINRIRLEFKVLLTGTGTASGTVLIESDWNLKRKRR